MKMPNFIVLYCFNICFKINTSDIIKYFIIFKYFKIIFHNSEACPYYCNNIGIKNPYQ